MSHITAHYDNETKNGVKYTTYYYRKGDENYKINTYPATNKMFVQEKDASGNWVPSKKKGIYFHMRQSIASYLKESAAIEVDTNYNLNDED